jgi:hypothetical protein
MAKFEKGRSAALQPHLRGGFVSGYKGTASPSIRA